MLVVTAAPNNRSFYKSSTTLYQQVCCHALEAFQHFLQIILVLLNRWLKIEARVDQAERLNNPKPNPSPSLQMLPAGLQHSSYLFISPKIPPQIPSLSTWLQSSEWDRVGSVPFVLLGKPSHHHFFGEMAALWLTVFRFQIFPCICLMAAFSGCCSWGWRLAAVRASPQEPSRTLEHLLEEVTPWGGAPLHTDRPKSKHGKRVTPHGCAHGCSCWYRCAELLLSGMGWLECLLFHFWLIDWPLTWTPATPQVSQIYLIYKLKEDLALLHATEHQRTLSILIDNSTPSVILTVLFAVVSSSYFFNFFLWLHMVNENCCMQRALFCYQLNSHSLAGFWKPEVVAVLSFLLENFSFPQGNVQGNMLVCSHTFTM